MNLISQDLIDVERWRRIESVLDVALDLEPGDVGAYLDRACAGRPELRAEIEDLLEADRQAHGFLSVPALVVAQAFAAEEAPATAGGSPAEASPRARDLPPPDRLGHYRVLDVLGRGGMGIVYRGRDEALEREVAIKALPDAVAADPERLARFLREAKLLGALHHPNIAGIRGVEQAHGRRYLILEKVDGSTLLELLRTGPLPLDEALDACSQVATALAAAHAYGIVHRDLKPGNIMRTPGGLVKVLDFGLAMHVSQPAPASGPAVAPKGIGPAGLQDRDATRAGARLGTPGYMSPEQIRGLPQDERADLFALGAVLYQCLTGVRAFPGRSIDAVITATLRATPDVTRLPAATPDSVRALLARMLEADPSRRAADAAAAADVLRRATGARGGPARESVRASGTLRLPAGGTRFVGRRREIADALVLLERAPMVTLVGPGGVGKSRLAVEIARAAYGVSTLEIDGLDSAPRFEEVWFADLSEANDSVSVSAAIAAAAELRDPSETGLDGAAAARLGGRSGLLVLDNCDRALPACTTASNRLLAGLPGLRILATGRERIGASREQTLRVPPLSVPDPETAASRDAVAAADSVRLFAACAGGLPDGFRVTDSNAGLVAEICRNLDGVPLAIELTAALLRDQRLEDVAGELRRRVGVSVAGGGPRDHGSEAAAAHDPLQVAIGIGYERLDADERRFFRAISVFAGGCNLEAAAAVCDGDADAFATLDRLTRLIDKSLVTIQRADRIEPRYRLLEPIRRFAAAQRERHRDDRELRERHRGWFLALAERTAPLLLQGSDQVRGLSVLEADHPNLLAALAECEADDDGAEPGLRLAGLLWLFWYIRGHFARGREALGRALDRPGADAPTPARAQALFAAGGLALFQGDFSAGRVSTQSALALYRSLDDPMGVARSLTHLALCESGEGHYAEAQAHIEQAIPLFRAVGDSRRLSAALNNLGVFKRQQGDPVAAVSDHEEALALQRQAGDRDGMLVTLLNLGLASARGGQDVMAAGRTDEALALVQELRARRSGAAALEVAAEVLAIRGQDEAGARLLGAAKALRSRIGLASDRGWQRMQAELARRLGASLGERFDRLVESGGEGTFEGAIHEARVQLAAGPSEPHPPAGPAGIESRSGREIRR